MIEEKILAGNFLFVSYCHEDKDYVREDIRALQVNGARIWFDENMHVSDDWEKIAKEKINHPNCKGVIFYNSKEAFLSSAVSLERQSAIDRAKKEQDFGLYSVNLGGKSMQEIYKETLVDAPDDYLKGMQEILPYFNDTKLFIRRIDSAGCVKEIYEEIIRPKLAVDEVGMFEDAMKRLQTDERKPERFRFGSYFGVPCNAPLKHSAPTERFVSNKTEYIAYKNELFGLRPLEWELLYMENSIAVLLCSEILDVAGGGENAKIYLKEIFAPLAFSEKEKALLHGDPRLLTLSDVKKAEKLSAPNGENEHRHWWIDAPGLLDHWQMTYCGNVPYSNGFNSAIKKGIRPVIELPFDKFR